MKVFLVSPNSHFYWNVAAVRGVIPGAIPDEQLFLPIETSFAQHSTENFEFVLGKAKNLDAERKTVEVARNDGSRCSLPYDQLVIATGSQILSNLPFKPVGTHEETLAALHSLQKQTDDAKSIVVAGAGLTGVETAGELAATYGNKKDITLIIGGEHVLQTSHVLPSVHHVVERDLQKLGVKLVYSTQVKGVQTTAKEDQGETSQTTLRFSNGSDLVADLYLPLFGVQVNTDFLPLNLLDSAGNLSQDKTMRVLGTKNVWAIGDVGNIETKQLTVTDAQIIHLSAALDSVLTGDDRRVREYKPSSKKMIFITMDKKHAIGQIGGWKLWGWMVSYVKGRMLFVDTARGYVDGKHLRHASM